MKAATMLLPFVLGLGLLLGCGAQVAPLEGDLASISSPFLKTGAPSLKDAEGAAPGLSLSVDTLLPRARALFRLLNEERRKHGLAPLTLNGALTRAAQAHAEDMRDNGVLTHTGRGGRSPSARVSAAGYAFATMGENIAYGYRTPEDVMKAWMNSSGHRAAILNPRFREVGIGLAKGADGPWWVQDFGVRK